METCLIIDEERCEDSRQVALGGVKYDTRREQLKSAVMTSQRMFHLTLESIIM